MPLGRIDILYDISVPNVCSTLYYVWSGASSANGCTTAYPRTIRHPGCGYMVNTYLAVELVSYILTMDCEDNVLLLAQWTVLLICRTRLQYP